MGKVRHFHPGKRELFHLGTANPKPVSTPAGIRPPPRVSVLSMPAKRKAHVTDRNIGQAHVGIKGDGFTAAGQCDLVPAVIAAVADQAELGVAGRW